MALTEEEKVRVRHHLGFLNVVEAQTFVLGTPAGVETQFIIEGAMNRVKEEALPLLRRMLSYLDLTEEQMVTDQDVMVVDQIGEITVRKEQQKQLRQVYKYWQQSLANVLGVYPNPFDKRGMGVGGAGGPNVPVMG